MNTTPHDQGSLTDGEKYSAAKAHVEALKGFYIHATVFAIVMSALVAVDAANGDSWWVQWPLIGWGLGVLGHAYLVFQPRNKSLTSWEERKIRETISKM
jgi:hypothetical protein